MSNSVYISYSRRDLSFVIQLQQELTNRGISAWFDKGIIEDANQWRISIVESIRDCKVFLLILSPDSVASVNVRKEIELAEHHNKEIMPLIWRDVYALPPSIQHQLAGLQYLYFRETPSTENFDQLARILTQLLEGLLLEETLLPQSSQATSGSVNRLSAKKQSIRKRTVRSNVIGGTIMTAGVTN
jgi:hypothetical protein